MFRRIQEKMTNYEEKFVWKYVKNSHRRILYRLGYSLADNFKKNHAPKWRHLKTFQKSSAYNIKIFYLNIVYGAI
jgi:hypothetical protein